MIIQEAIGVNSFIPIHGEFHGVLIALHKQYDIFISQLCAYTNHRQII